MKIQTNILLLALVIILSQSCTRYAYVPNAHNVPMIKEKKEFRATITPSELQMAYGISDNVGIMINGQISKDKNSGVFIVTDATSKRRMIETGIGYMKSSGSTIFEIYGGVGIGKVSFGNKQFQTGGNNSYNLTSFSSNFSRFFVQPSIGWNIDDHLEIAFSLRATRLKFYNKDVSTYTYEPYGRNTDLNNIDQGSYSFIEPGITIRGGFKKFKFFIQFQRINQLNSNPINYMKGTGKIGFQLALAPRFKKETIREEF